MKKKRHKPPPPHGREWDSKGRPVFAAGNTAASGTKAKPKNRQTISLEMKNWASGLLSDIDKKKLLKMIHTDPEYSLAIIEQLLKVTTTTAGTDQPEVLPGSMQQEFHLHTNVPRPPFQVEQLPANAIEAEVVDVPALPAPPVVGEPAAAEPIEVVLEDDEEEPNG